MDEPIRPVKKPHGCWWFSGCLITVVSALLCAFFISMIFVSEEKMDKNREEYTASTREYEDAMRAYEADSAHLRAEYRRILDEIDQAEARKDSVRVEALTDSLDKYAEPMWTPRGHIGFNIGGAFFLLFAVMTLIPMAIGLLLLLIYWYKRRKWRKNNRLDIV